MSFFNDDSILFTCMLGVVVVVMGGVGLSLVVDRRLSESKSEIGCQRDFHSDSVELGRLRVACDVNARRLQETESSSRKAADAFASVRRNLEGLGLRRMELTAELESQGKAVTGIEAEFSRYRLKYRDVAWSAAEGTSLGNLRIRDGREFQDVVISKVTAAGLEIRHSDGCARVPARDLDSSLHERFQWHGAAKVSVGGVAPGEPPPSEGDGAR